MTFNEVQVYVGAVILGALFGAYHGWRREVISMAIILSTVLFLMLHGIEAIVRLSSSTATSFVPTASAKGLSGGGPSGPSGPGGTSAQSGGGPYQSDSSVVCTNGISLDTIGVMIFFLMVFLAYRIGWRWGNPARNSNDRILGMLPGAINGGAIMFYLSHSVFKGEVITLLSPSAWQASHDLPLVIAVAFIVLLLLIFIASQARKSGGAAH